MMTRIRTLALAVVFVAAAVGCSSSSSTAPSTSGSGSSAGGHTVTIKDFTFTPSTLTVKAGTKVTFVNDDSTTHTATSQGSSTINSGNLAKGQSYTVTLIKPGTYHYICSIHNYMTGTVVVQQ
jgi:plastocyanin